MRKTTLFLLFFVINIVWAQNTFDISWGGDMNATMTNPIIEVGDAVRWTWNDATPKSVTSTNEATENFDSGILSGINRQYVHTFKQVGVSEYQNDANPSLSGKVTVVQKLTSEDKFVKNLSFYPNPVETALHIYSLFKLEQYQIFNVLGSLVVEGKGDGHTTVVDMSNMNSGLYFVKVFSKDMQATLKVAKR